MPASVPDNYRYVFVALNSSFHEKKAEKSREYMVDDHKSKERPSVYHQLKHFYAHHSADVNVLSHPTVEQLKADSHFDAVIFDYLYNDYNLGIAAHFRCPAIMLASHALNAPTRNFVGNPSAAAFTKSILVSGAIKMNFFERVQNHLIIAIEQLFLVALDYSSKSYYDSHFPAHLGYPSYHDARRNIALVLTRSDSLLSGPLLSFPNVRTVGGLQIPRMQIALPPDLQEWFDSSEDDVIYMSFGTNLNCAEMSAERLRAFVTVFSRLQGLRVLWKWGGDTLPDQPANVRIGQWFPQAEVVAHPKVKLYISHCGLGAISEARSNAVPVLGIPFFSDQFANLEQITDEGWAMGIRFADVTEQQFSQVLNEMLANDRFRHKAEQVSAIYRDRLMHPLDEAIYWVEYVLRHSGAKHMQNHAVDLNWLQYHSLDVFAFLCGSAFIIWKLAGWIVRRWSSRLLWWRRKKKIY